LAGFASTLASDLSTVGCQARIPLGGAESMATPAEPRPLASRIWTNSPPNEWPTKAGGSGRLAITEA